MLPLSLGLTVMLALIVGEWDVDRWSGVPVERVLAFLVILLILGMLAAAMMEWEMRSERRRWGGSCF
jgi:hypothetical protein